MHLLLALALLPSTASAAPPSGPLAECAVSEHDETTTLLQCRNWMASLARIQAEPGAWDAMVGAHLVGITLGSGATLGAEHLPRTIAGHAFLTATLTTGQADAPVLRGTVAWTAQEGPTLEVLSCVYPVRDPEGAARCDSALEALADGGVPRVLPAHDPQVPRIVGRPVPVAEGCSAQHEAYAGMINCMAQGGGSLQWVQLGTPAGEAELTALREGSLRELTTMRPGTWTAEELTCRLEGTPGTCWRFSQEAETPPRRSLVAYAVFRGIPLVAKCLYRGEPGVLPAPCSEILGF